MRIESLGKRALFLIPSIKVYNSKYSKSKQSVAKTIHRFKNIVSAHGHSQIPDIDETQR